MVCMNYFAFSSLEENNEGGDQSLDLANDQKFAIFLHSWNLHPCPSDPSVHVPGQVCLRPHVHLQLHHRTEQGPRKVREEMLSILTSSFSTGRISRDHILQE